MAVSVAAITYFWCFLLVYICLPQLKAHIGSGCDHIHLCSLDASRPSFRTRGCRWGGEIVPRLPATEGTYTVRTRLASGCQGLPRAKKECILSLEYQQLELIKIQYLWPLISNTSPHCFGGTSGNFCSQGAHAGTSFLIVLPWSSVKCLLHKCSVSPS